MGFRMYIYNNFQPIFNLIKKKIWFSENYHSGIILPVSWISSYFKQFFNYKAYFMLPKWFFWFETLLPIGKDNTTIQITKPTVLNKY